MAIRATCSKVNITDNTRTTAAPEETPATSEGSPGEPILPAPFGSRGDRVILAREDDRPSPKGIQ